MVQRIQIEKINILRGLINAVIFGRRGKKVLLESRRCQ